MKKLKLPLVTIMLFIVIFFPSYLCNAGGSEKACPPGQVCLDNPLTGNQSSISPQVFIGRIINAILGIVGSLALAMFIYGGFTWMTAAGNSEKVEKGKQILLWATIGLVVIFTSYALVRFVLFNVAPSPVVPTM
ncbi:MAG: pilin [Patescibacteria group bacterium]|nr:pilin [Patescibacteria group bacterium]